MNEETLTLNEGLAALGEFLDLGTGTSSLSVHGVESGALFDLMQDGQLDELKRERRQGCYGDDEKHYLIGKTKVGRVDVVLFSGDLP